MSALSPTLRALVDLPDAERKLGAFVLVRQLGRGGFAPVWLAREVYADRELRTAAVKLFALDAPTTGPASGSHDSNAARHRHQVIDEAQSLCKVEHPNIVRFYSLLVDEQRGVIGLAMEYVDGEPLDARIEKKEKLSVEETLDVGIAVASALAAVHKNGLVHRDVKPANVVESGGVFKLIDFGIASADTPASPAGVKRSKRVVLDDLPLEIVGTKMSMLDAAYTIRTHDGSDGEIPYVATGTLGYIDPACLASGAPATASSDLYGLGALLFECLTGKLPALASAPSGAGLRGEVLDGRAPAVAVRKIEPAVPEALAKVVDALLDPSRESRPASAADVARALDAIRSPAKDAATPIVSVPERRRSAALPIALAVVVIGGGALAFGLSRRPPSPAASATSAPAPPVPAPSSGPASDVTPAIRAVRLSIVPPIASVDVDGAPASVTDGTVEIRGTLGSLHNVRVYVGKKETVGDVVIAESGAVPAKIELGVKPAPPASAIVAMPKPAASSAAPSAVAPVTTKSSKGTTTPPLDRKFDP